jgi:2-keto-4-pentenoate hydratase/2-oxohepta-3-ene-1,7-dioic acid hydratase in catechol pathway
MSFRTDAGASFGLARDDGVVDLGRRLAGRCGSLREVLAAGALDELAELANGADIDHPFDEIDFLPVIPEPGRIVCIGLNYRDHVDEMAREMPPNPSLFAKWPDALVGHDQPIVRPLVSEHYDFEGELALIIGRGGRHIPEAEALDHIAGYSCFVDGSIRDFQRHSVIAGKNFPGSGACGPWLVTADEIPDPSALQLTTTLNGHMVQQAGAEQLIYAIPTIIAYISTFTSLGPGDVIATGTPSGVGAGRTPPLWLRPGDELVVEISGIGRLRNRVVAEET